MLRIILPLATLAVERNEPLTILSLWLRDPMRLARDGRTSSDPLVRWDGGWFDLTPARTTVSNWRERNRCSAQVATLYRQGDALCEAPRCAADTISCVIDGGGHTWPGALIFPFLGHTSSDVDSTSTMLDFFLDHPLRAYSPISPAIGLSASIK